MIILPLIVDSREKKEVRKWLFQKGVRYNVKALKTGDYLFYDKDETNRILVERKTVSDLVSSYRDGRLKSQLLRMSEEQYPILLVTGSIKDVEKYVKVDRYIVQKVISDAMIRYGFRGVIWVVNEHYDANTEGLILLSDMFKDIELGNLDVGEAVKKRRKSKPKNEVVSKAKKKVVKKSPDNINGVPVANEIKCTRCGSDMMVSTASKKLKWVCKNLVCK